MLKRVMSRYFAEFFCLTVQKISQGNPLVCHNFRVSKNFMIKRVMSQFFVDFFLSNSAEKIRR